MLQALLDGCPSWQENTKRQQEIKAEYGNYLQNFTAEEIEWYGLSWEEAIKKLRQKQDADNKVVPHKIIFRQKLVDQLREVGITEAGVEGAK